MRIEDIVNEEKQRLDPSCWKGYKKQGTKMKGDTRVNNCVPAESVNESEYQELRKLQQQWWVALPAIMKKAGIDYHPVRELSRDYYPTLGSITIPGERFTTFEVNANPKGDSAKLNIHVDVNTSNEFYRTAQPEKAAKLSAFAEKIAQALGGSAAEHMTGERRNHPGVSHITATMTLPKEPEEWQNPSRGYNPRDRFLAQPGERARQSRVARSANPGSFGGDASNYTRFNEQGVAEEYNAEYDDEAGMADNNLETLERAVDGIDNLINSGDNLPEWCQEKIAVAKSMLVTVWDYMASEEGNEDPEIAEMYEAMEQFAEEIAVNTLSSVDAVWESFESMDDQKLFETAAWRRKEGKSKKGGLNAKGVASYRRENPGSKLQTAVTTKPSKLKPGSKAAKRRKSFCARMGGVKGPMKKPNGKPTRKALALRKWNC